MFRKIQSRLAGMKKRKFIRLLTQTDPSQIQKFGDNLVVPAFKKAYKEVPAFKEIYKGLDMHKITSLEMFLKKVPVIEKKDVFPKFALIDLCRNGDDGDVEYVMTSSGFSNLFAYGCVTKDNLQRLKYNIDSILDYFYDTTNKKTLIINALPMGVKFNTDNRLANTSVRPDMVWAILEKFQNAVDQFVIVSDPHFIKFLVEYLDTKMNNLRQLDIKLICGEDWMPESLRAYLLKFLAKSYDDPAPVVAQTMGLAELDLNLLHESQELIQVRKAISEDQKLKEAFFGTQFKYTPSLLHYYPHRCYIEVKGGKDTGQLVFSMLSSALLIPLFRYNSKDIGKLFTYEEFCSLLEKNGLGNHKPHLKLPVCAVFGRENKYAAQGKKKVYSEEIKEALYKNYDIAKVVTGMFHLSAKNRILVEIQLREGTKNSDKLQAAVEKEISTYLGFSVQVKVYEYLKFPHQIKLDYETKFRTV